MSITKIRVRKAADSRVKVERCDNCLGNAVIEAGVGYPAPYRSYLEYTPVEQAILAKVKPVLVETYVFDFVEGTFDFCPACAVELAS